MGFRGIAGLVVVWLLFAACGTTEPTATPNATPSPIAAVGAAIVAARADLKDVMALYGTGHTDAAYEKAASIYLEQIEGLEPALLKVDKNFVPVLEGDFTALRDGIKTGRPKAELDAVAARLDGELVRAATMLGP